MSFVSERRFRIWDYNVSHNQMLLRSPKSPEVAKNIDIVFWGVEYIGIPTTLDAVELTRVENDDKAIGDFLPAKAHEAANVYRLASGQKQYFVAASGFKVLENELDIFDSSLEYFGAPDPARDLGDVLSHS
ncbi:MAG TPA: hypothetical protein VHV55_23380 [Pirellulales bacterium]|jgi:hypothetical protein|nr:hypothetical protein [Pirellulales bacterium]